MKYLGTSFDLHTGGVDHIAIHHTNEIAQSEGATGKLFSKYWMHGEFLTIDGGRMGKSLGNAYTLHDVIKRGFDPLALRYFYFSAYYRTVLNFTWQALEASQTELMRLRGRVAKLRASPNGVSVGITAKFEDARARFLSVVNDDLNIPTARAFLWSVLGDDALSSGEKLKLVLDFDRVFGLKLAQSEDVKRVPEEVLELAKKRDELRAQKKFVEADQVREEIGKLGYTVNDLAEGSSVVEV
jgi:cysteinyl-tRNA synthetase